MRLSSARYRFLAFVCTVAVFVTSCGSENDAGQAADDGNRPRLQVVASTTVLGDVVSRVGGESVWTEVLLPVGVDPHEFQLSVRQAELLREADLVVVNGLGLEAGLVDVLDAAAADGSNVLEVAPLLDPLPFTGDGDDLEADTGAHNDEGHDDEHEHGGFDPHVWMDPVRMADAASAIANALAAVDDGVDWATQAAAYSQELLSTDARIRAILSVVPPQRRKLVTNHDSLGYFAERYAFELVGTVIPGGATLAEPSPADLSALVEVIRREGVPAIFAETTSGAALAEAVAAEVESDIGVVDLYTGSLGEPGSGADTLIGLLLTNAQRIADALS